jgi:DNA-binding NarL/FixJ family response regulator
MTPIRILIADDHPVFRFGMRALLDAMPDTDVVGDTTTGEAAITLSADMAPDVVLMDINMPGSRVPRAARRGRATIQPSRS